MAHLCPFTPITRQKIKIPKKWRKGLEISSFSTSVTKIIIIWNTAPEILCMTDVIFVFYFVLLLLFYSPFPLITWKIKLKKYLWRYHCFIWVPKIMITWYTVPKIWCATDGWSERWKKWHTKVNVPPDNIYPLINPWLSLSLPSHMLLSHIVQQTKIKNFKTLIDNIYSNAFISIHNTWPSPPISYCSWHFLKSNIYIIKYTFFYTKSFFFFFFPA